MQSNLPPIRQLRLGSRTSKLALWQTNHIIQCLQSVWPELDCSIIPFSTVGDKTQNAGKPLPEIGGKGVFTAELEEALRQGVIDLAVHSLKDLPVENAEGLTLGAITNRADVRDALVARHGWTLATLPVGAKVGTSSTRRTALLQACRPDLQITSIRGNVDTRVRKVLSGEYDATLLAMAGLERLQMTGVISEVLSLEQMLPAPGQGALAVQCRADDDYILTLLAAIDDLAVRAATTAERTFLAKLGGGCSAPVAAYAEVQNDRLIMQALVAAVDGADLIRVQGSWQQSTTDWRAEDGVQLGTELARQALAKGADQLLHNFFGTGRAEAHVGVRTLPRILIPRRAEQAQELTLALTQLGATPLLVPVIKIVPVEDWSLIDQAIGVLASYDWLVFTSVNAVELFFQRLQTLGCTLPNTLSIVVIGTATATALRAHNFEPSLIPEESTGEKIAESLGDLAHKTVLLPQATIARRNLREALEARGAEVHAVAIYDTIAVEPTNAMLDEIRKGIDIVLFTSGSTVRNLVTALQKHELVPILHNAKIICIGPITAEEARQCGLEVAGIAERQSTEGMVEAIKGL